MKTVRIVLTLYLVQPSHCLAAAAAAASSSSSPSSHRSIETLLSRAQSLVDEGNSKDAFEALAQVYSQDPDAPGLARLFEACLRLRLDNNSNSNNNGDEDKAVQDRFGLAALLLDQERYEEASVQLRLIINHDDSHRDGRTKYKNDNAIMEKASSMLFRSNAACCHWDSYVQDSTQLVESLRLADRTLAAAAIDKNPNDVPAVHPFEALKWPCITLPQATQIAALYAQRSIASTAADASTRHCVDKDAIMVNERIRVPIVSVSRESDATFVTNRKIRLGYISPDFTSRHPLAFLMQHVFGYHNRDHFEVKLYSLSRWDEEGPEVQNIQNGCDSFTVLPAKSPEALAKLIEDDELDILVDLCGYAGTDRISQVLSLRPAPVQVSYMGFPASSGAPYLDYLVCDATVVPPDLRRYYTELLIQMPHCYFVNSHASSVSNILLVGDGVNKHDDTRRQELRRKYNLPRNAFVYCCHSRPDKIDPSTFRTWLRALKEVRRDKSNGRCEDDAVDGNGAVLWLLRSGLEMEVNLLKIARDEFQLEESALVFCDVAPREEHLQRLTCADVFLDTPAYNAHTLGCDTLFAGIPMISLLRRRPSETNESILDPLFCDTDKLASRVGASLLKATGLGEDMVCDTMRDYANLMVKCAIEKEWYASIRCKLFESKQQSCPLFDTRRWVENFELALRQIVLDKPEGADIVVLDDDKG